MWLKKLLIAGAAVAGVMLGTGEAKANEYICYVRYVPASGTNGTEGYVTYSSYTGPNCTGSFIQSASFCSTGATAGACPSSTAYRYERQGLLALFQALQAAVAADQDVVVAYTSNCNSSTITACPLYATFWAL